MCIFGGAGLGRGDSQECSVSVIKVVTIRDNCGRSYKERSGGPPGWTSGLSNKLMVLGSGLDLRVVRWSPASGSLH